MKKSILFSVLFLVSSISIGQEYEANDPFYIQENIPSSPEVSTLGEYGNFEATPYNGKVGVSIPFHSIQWEGMEIPIILSYDTGGVKVATDASWVGLNWNMSTNFGIQRKIYGGDDFNTKVAGSYSGAPLSGYIYNPLGLELEEGQARPYLSLDDILNVHHSFSMSHIAGRRTPFLDTQPDVFTANIFGKSYKFILDKKEENSNILTTKIFNNNVAIITFDLANKTFQLVDESGFIYDFGTKEVNTTFNSIQGDTSTPPGDYLGAFWSIFATYNRNDNGLITNWQLDKVRSPNGRELDFNYEKGLHFSFPSYTISGDTQDNTTFHPFGQEQFDREFLASTHDVSTTVIENNYLQSISGDFGEVNFLLGTREDLTTGHAIDELSEGGFGAKVLITGMNTQIRSCHGTNNSCGTSTQLKPLKLNGIEVRNSNNDLVKEIELHHGYFNENKLGSLAEERYLRLKLDSLNINDQKYSFQYISPNALSAKDSFSQDFWGYDNGVTSNVTLAPTIGRFLTVPTLIPPSQNNTNGYLGTVNHTFFNFEGAIRKSNFAYAKRGALEKITYPTGGSTRMEFEPHNVVLEAPAPFVKTSDHLDSSEYGYSGPSRIKWTNMIDESQYKLTYQYLKYANDNTYNYFEKTAPEIEGDPITIPLDLYQSFTVDFPSVLQIDGELQTQTGWDGLNYWGNSPLIVLINLDTGEETTIFTYSEAPNDYGNTAPINTVSRNVNVAPGEYTIAHSTLETAPDLPPIPIVQYTSSQNLLYTYESIVGGDLSYFMEQFEIGGLRIKKIINEDGDQNFVNGKTFNYDFPEGIELYSSSGKLMDDLVFHSKNSGFYSYTPRNHGSLQLTSHNVVGGNDSAMGSHIGYSFVTEANIDENNVAQGWIENEYFNDKNEYFSNSFNLPYSYDSLQGNGDAFITVLGIDMKWTCSGLDFGNDCAGETQFWSSKGYVETKNTLVLGIPLKLNFSYSNGNLKEQRLFNNQNSLIRKTTNDYSNLRVVIPDTHFANFMNVRIPLITSNTPGETISQILDTWQEGPWGANHHTYFPYLFPEHHGIVTKLKNTKTYNYFDSGQLFTESMTEYDPNTHFVKSFKNFVNEEDTNSLKLFYPNNDEVFNNPFVSQLRSENRFSQVIKQQKYRNEEVISTIQYDFENSLDTQNHTLVKSKSSSKGLDGLEVDYQFEKYDDFGNLLQMKYRNGVSVSYLYSYNKQYPVAKIENATQSEISQLSLGSIEGSLSSTQETALRSGLPNAQVTTYSYEPLVGVTSVTDPRGNIIYYVYDEQNRLKFIKDKDGKVLTQNEYNYKTN